MVTESARSAPLPAAGAVVKTVPLSVWDQVSMRSYMRVVLCFPFLANGDNLARASSCLRSALARLKEQRPDFAGRILAGNDDDRGRVFLRTSPSDSIPFEMQALGDDFASYETLKSAAFPPEDFVHPRFSIPHNLDKGPAPVASIKAFAIQGGLMLTVFFHHSIADGECLRIFLESFAAQTRKTPIRAPFMPQFDFPKQTLSRADSAELVSHLPEYTLLPEPYGPTVPYIPAGGVPIDEIDRTGKIFTFDNDRLACLRRALAKVMKRSKVPSNYTCLAAWAWAHISRARMRDDEFVPRTATDLPARLQTMVNWKKRVDGNARYENYFGNATAIAVTTSVASELASACQDLSSLGCLVRRIEASIQSVDDAFVNKRTAFFDSISDPRRVGLASDPRTPTDLAFNTWRFFGADTAWDIPGVPSRVPDTVRKAQETWGLAGALILPARKTSQVHELLITLPSSSMRILCQDKDWSQLNY